DLGRRRIELDPKLRGLTLEILLQIQPALLQHFEAFLGMRHIGAVAADAAGGSCRRAQTSDLRGTELLAPEQRAEDGRSNGKGGLHLALGELIALAANAVFGAPQLIFERLQTRRVGAP